MLVCSVPITANADSMSSYYKDVLLQGLADKEYTKTVDNYDGYHFVRGTKAVWDCKLYTLTATVTKVEKSIATFNVTFNSKIPYKYLQSDGWHDYYVKAYSNTQVSSYSFRPSEQSSMTFTVDTSEADQLSSSATSGMQFVEFVVEKNERYPDLLDGTVYSSNPYEKPIEDFAKSSDRRSVYPGNGAFNEYDICDTWALGYYISPDYAIFKTNYQVTKNSIRLGIHGFDGILKYRVKGASKWQEKAFPPNSNMIIKGLKAGTTYQLWPLCKIYYTDPETGDKMYTLDQVASPFCLTTALTQKPKVTSVKISKVKYGKQTINGYWESDGDWHPTETFNTAKYTITVKVKNVPKKAAGLRMTTGGATYYAKGNKNTYTYTVTYRDKKKVKGKKITTNFAYSSNTNLNSALGIGPAKKATYKIKNGTYKVK